MSNAGCSTPSLRLVYVRQQHEASPNVRYLPACTWLHRCSDEIGCCTDDSKTCSASHIESVSLPFFVRPFIHGPFFFFCFVFFLSSFDQMKTIFPSRRGRSLVTDTGTLFFFSSFALCFVSGITHMNVCLFLFSFRLLLLFFFILRGRVQKKNVFNIFFKGVDDERIGN